MGKDNPSPFYLRLADAVGVNILTSRRRISRTPPLEKYHEERRSLVLVKDRIMHIRILSYPSIRCGRKMCHIRYRDAYADIFGSIRQLA